jgi:GNAT superfamily N-acetyltransferase
MPIHLAGVSIAGHEHEWLYSTVVAYDDWPGPPVWCACVTATDQGLMPVGAIRWATGEAGEIFWIWVDPERRRLGIATQLLAVAGHVAKQEGWVPPAHSEERTPAGDAWARSLGAEPAAFIYTDQTGTIRAAEWVAAAQK